MRCAPRASNGPNHLGLCVLQKHVGEVTIGGLVNGVAYTITVEAVNSAGASMLTAPQQTG